ncbi:MAG: hypothetical protein ACT4QG_18620 [Sporichthyaceae bacterium]
MIRHVYVDETKAAGYVLAAVVVADPGTVRKTISGLIAPGTRRLHMHNERPQRRPGIVAALAAAEIQVRIYDAARRYRTDLAARAACLSALVEDLAECTGHIRLVIERDDSLLSFDNQRLIEAVRANGLRQRLSYHHDHAHAEPLLALPDVAAWCWARSGQWRRHIEPILTAVRTV